MINAQKIYQFLSEPQKSRLSFEILQITESTNDVALACAPGTVVIADQQTKGRGRENREFYSGKGGIYMSVSVESTQIYRLTVRFASATARAIEQVLGKSVGIKWVNDLIVGGKKVCGILCESRVQGDQISAVAGVGINLCGEIPDSLKDIAGTLENNDEKKEELVAKILDNFYEEWDFLDYYRKKSLVLGKKIEVDGKIYEATDIDDEGGLVLQNETERVVKRTGEIRIALADLL